MRFLFIILFVASMPVLADGTPSPTVDARAMEIQVHRYDGELYRAIRFSTESLYPCLRFERLSPDDGWETDIQRDICSVRTEGGDALDFRDSSYTGFRDLRFEKGSFQFDVEFIPRHASGEQVASCALSVKDLEGWEPLVCNPQ